MIERNKGLSYVDTVDMVDRYTYFLEGRRVMDVLVDTKFEVGSAELGEGVEVPVGTTLHRILIAQVDAPPSAAQVTKGIATRTPHLEKDAEGQEGLHTHVSSQSVSSYLVPRVTTMLARLFVPPAAVSA